MKKDLNVNFPEIQKRRRRRKFFLKIGLSLFLFGLVIFGVIRVIFYSPMFRFDNVVLSVDDLEKEKILSFLKTKIAQGSFLTRSLGFNNFLAWPNEISSSELTSLPEIESLKIGKNYQAKILSVAPVERKPFGIWCLKKNNPTECFWFNEEGIIFKESPVTSGNLIKVVSDYYQDHLSLGGKVLPQKLVSNLISILKTLSALEINVKEVILKDLNLKEIEITTYTGPKIYFSLLYSAESYESALRSLFINPKIESFEYIDLRAPNRVYYQ